MSEEQNIQEPIYEDTYHKEMWNNIVEELNKMEFGKEIEFTDFGELKLHCYNRLDYEGPFAISCCFACEYADNFKWKCKICENCPFEGIDLDKSCLNDVHNVLCACYTCLCVIKNKQIFNLLKQECIEYVKQIRDWKIRDNVLYRSNIK